MNNTIREIETLPAGVVRTSVVCPGEMADLVRSYDWGSTELGSIANWSEALIGVVNLALSSPDPVALQLGTRLLLIYNDAYRTILNEAHPAALGAQMEVVWNYLWPQIGWQLQAVMSEGKVVAGDQVTVPAKRNGKSEDHYWNYSFTPIFNGKKVIGVYNTCQDVTAAVLSMRALCESDEKLRHALSATGGVSLWRLDVVRDVVRVDACLARVFGLDPARASSGVTMDELLATLEPGHVAMFRETLAHAAATGRPFFLEHPIEAANGDLVWIALQGRCILNLAGKVEEMAGITVILNGPKQEEHGETLIARAEAMGGLFPPESEALLAQRAMLNLPELESRVVAADRIFGAVVVSFETGQSLLYPANVLLAASRYAIDLTSLQIASR